MLKWVRVVCLRKATTSCLEYGLEAKDGLVGWFVGFVHPITKKIESKAQNNNMNHSFPSTSQVPTHVGGYGDVQSIEERK
jgi:hypothetical protein